MTKPEGSMRRAEAEISAHAVDQSSRMGEMIESLLILLDAADRDDDLLDRQRIGLPIASIRKCMCLEKSEALKVVGVATVRGFVQFAQIGGGGYSAFVLTPKGQIEIDRLRDET